MGIQPLVIGEPISALNVSDQGRWEVDVVYLLAPADVNLVPHVLGNRCTIPCDFVFLFEVDDPITPCFYCGEF